MTVADRRTRARERTAAAPTRQEGFSLAFLVGEPGSDGVVTCNVRANDLPVARPAGLLSSVFRVTVTRTDSAEIDDLPDVAGRYEVSEDAVRFVPHFPFEPGVSYRATLDPRMLRQGSADVLSIEFSPPLTSSVERTEVTQVFPSRDCLPENVLRFYVCFANSMQRGHCATEIVLLGPDGTPALDVLYRPPVELWDVSMRFLTILLDPGRLKRMVGPNRDLGPPLTVGQTYTLVIGAGMADRSGRVLPRPYRKEFRVEAAARQRLEPDRWAVRTPQSGSYEPLTIGFPRPLDWALLARSISVIFSSGEAIHGRISIDQEETRWTFEPTLRWRQGAYCVQIEPDLEDVCGNGPLAAFDRPMRSGSDLQYEAARSSIAFYVS